MTIKIVRNDAGNCINFVGTSNPVYFNACLSAEVDSGDNTFVNIINDIQTATSGVNKYEFYNIPYTEFRDKDNGTFADAQAAADYITLNGNVSAPTDIAVAYRGAYNAATNTPDVTTDVSGFSNGEWYFVTTAGSRTFNSVSYDLAVNDQIRFNSANSDWDVIVDTNVKVNEITSSALDAHDIHVDGSYTGTIRNGSSLYPYNDLNTAITASSDGDTLLIKGEIVIPNSSTDGFEIPHSLYLYGTDRSVVRYSTYDASNGNVFVFNGTDNTKEILFYNLEIKNAGKYGMLIKKAKEVTVESCTLDNNGWDGGELVEEDWA